MIASLGMYDRAETAAANDRYWALICQELRARGTSAPEALTRGDGAYWPAWQAEDLVLSQTCGLPYRARLHQDVTLIGTPDFGVEGCAPGFYHSVFVARKSDTRDDLAAFSGADFAYNDALSQSGWAAPKLWADSSGFQLRPCLETGSHLLSAKAVLDETADFAAVDAVSWSMMLDHDAWSGDLKVIGRTPTSPGLPYIAARGADADTTFAAVAAAIAALAPSDRATLRLRGLQKISPERYLAVPIPEAPAQFAQAI